MFENLHQPLNKDACFLPTNFLKLIRILGLYRCSFITNIGFQDNKSDDCSNHYSFLFPTCFINIIFAICN